MGGNERMPLSKESLLAKYEHDLKGVANNIRKYREELRQLEEELETVKHNATKEAIQNRIWKLMWKTNEYIMIWDDLMFRVEMLEKEIKEQGGEIG